MKKFTFKIITLALTILMAIGCLACTYRKDGSVVQDVTFNVSYTDTEDNVKDIAVTANFYKTFAPKTCEHLLKYIKDGNYNNTSLVMDKTGSYLVLGSFNYTENGYEEIVYTGDTVEGEFKKNGWTPRLRVEVGSLVLLREPDTGKGTSKYNSGKVSVAIILKENTNLTNDYYTVFGKIDIETIEQLNDMADTLLKDDDGDIKIRYLGDRDESTDNLIVVNGKYSGGAEFYINVESSVLKNLDKEEIEKEISEGEENPLYKKYSEANTLDLYALPIKPIKVSNFKLK